MGGVVPNCRLVFFDGAKLEVTERAEFTKPILRIAGNDTCGVFDRKITGNHINICPSTPVIGRFRLQFSFPGMPSGGLVVKAGCDTFFAQIRRRAPEVSVAEVEKTARRTEPVFVADVVVAFDPVAQILDYQPLPSLEQILLGGYAHLLLEFFPETDLRHIAPCGHLFDGLHLALHGHWFCLRYRAGIG